METQILDRSLQSDEIFASSARLVAAYNVVATRITLAVQMTVITDKSGSSLRFHRVAG